MSTGSQKIFLVGPMGAGKTSIGRALARQLKLKFHDSDHEVQARCGADIPWIFDVEGEDGFRRREAEVIAELTQKGGIVLATGGGAVLLPENRACLAERGTVVYLKVGVDLQYERTVNDLNRPLLQTPERRVVIERFEKERGPLYREVADIIVEAEGHSLRWTVDHIIEQLSERVD